MNGKFDNDELLTVRELSGRIKYEIQSIRNLITKGEFRLGEHYLKPRHKVLFRWSKVEEWLRSGSDAPKIPMARG